MPYIPKAREIDVGGASVRVAQRERSDRKTAAAVPSATGGAPKVAPDNTVPGMAIPDAKLPKGLPIPKLPAELVPPPVKVYAPAEQTFLEENQRRDLPVIPFIRRGKRTLSEYANSNAEFVANLQRDLEETAANNPQLQARLVAFGGGPQEAAMRINEYLSKTFEIENNGPDLPSQIYAHSRARVLSDFLEGLHRRRT